MKISEEHHAPQGKGTLTEPVRRNTWQKEAIRSALLDSADFVSAQVLFQRLRDAGSGVGLATVYRTLAELAELGEVDSLNHEGETIYRSCENPSHHHHLICRICGKTVEINAEPVEAWAKNVAAQNGFTQPEHLIDIFALCAQCSAAQQRSSQL